MRMLKFAKYLLIAGFSLVLVLAALGTLTPQGRAAVNAGLFIPQVLPDLPIKPQKWFTRTPVLEETSYETASGIGVADIYRPGGAGKHSAVLFFQGVSPGGRFDPRIVALGEGLARAGMVVMIPWSDTQTTNRIATKDVDNLVRAFQHLRGLDFVDPNRVGMGGICVGASLTTVAAQDDRIRDNVRFINFFAGYYDASDFAKAIGSRSRFGDDYASSWKPDGLTLRIFRNHIIEGVESPDDRTLLERIFVDGYRETENDIDTFEKDAYAAYRLLKGVDYEEIDAVVAMLSPATKEFFRAISPSTNIDKLQARMLIMHDTADRLVPSEESRRLAAALEEGQVYHTEFSFFQRQIQVHIGDSEGISPIDYLAQALKLYMHIYNIMRDSA